MRGSEKGPATAQADPNAATASHALLLRARRLLVALHGERKVGELDVIREVLLLLAQVGTSVERRPVKPRPRTSSAPSDEAGE